MNYKVKATSVDSVSKTDLQHSTKYNWVEIEVSDHMTDLLQTVRAENVTVYNLRGSLRELNFVSIELKQKDKSNSVTSCNWSTAICIGRAFLNAPCRIQNVIVNHELGSAVIQIGLDK